MSDEATEYGKIGAKGRLTIPKGLRERLDLSEGDRVMLSVAEGRLEVVPMTLVPRDQAWFYHPEMQDRVAEAEADVAADRTARLEDPDDVESYFEELEGDG